MESLLKPEQVAEIFGVDVQTIYKMVRENKLQKVDLDINVIRFNFDYINSLCNYNDSDKTWREITLEKELDKLKVENQRLVAKIGQVIGELSGELVKL